MKSRVLVSLLSLVVISACGGDDEEGGGSGSSDVSSGVDESKPLNMLTSMEAQQINESIGEVIAADGEFVDAICEFTGVFSTTLTAMVGPDGKYPAEVQMQCNEAIAMCKSSFQMSAATAGATAGVAVPADASAFAQCSVTVGQLEACLTANLALVKETFAALGGSCEAPPATDTAEPVPTTEATVLPECEALQSAECSGAIAMGASPS